MPTPKARRSARLPHSRRAASISGMIKDYIYQKCSTCRNAIQWLEDQGIPHETAPIRETPPDIAELKHALKHLDGNLRKLFNTSGMDYRAMGLKDKLPTLSEADAIQLLNSNGNLVKRPLVIGKDFALAGFKAEQWKTTLKKD